MGEEGSFSPEGTRLAYVPFWNRRSAPGAYISWKHYRGGKASPIWIANLADSHIEKIPRKDSNDFNPMWVGDKVYFLSDREGPVSLFSYDPARKEVNRVLPANGQDILSASGGNGAIVYEQFGALHELDLASGKTRKIEIRLAGDFPAVRPRYEKVAKRIRAAGISPNGVRAVFEARGEILTVPAEKGTIRNMTNTPGVAERDPAWSPDGKWIAYFSDESGEYQLHLRDQRALTEPKKFTLGDPPSFYYSPVWSPDSKKIAYTDKRHNIWYLDIGTGKSFRVDTSTYDNPFHSLDPAAFRERMANMMKEQMNVNDDEWKVIQPKLEKVMTAQRDARGGGMGGMFGRGPRSDSGSQGNDSQRSAVQQAQQDLRTTLENKEAAADQIAAKLTALREARNKAREELASAQKELKDALAQEKEADKQRQEQIRQSRRGY